MAEVYKLDAKDFLPDTLQTNATFLKVIELFNMLISKERTITEEIEYAYNDAIYKTRDYSKLSYAAKTKIIDEMGFSYITEFAALTGEQLTKLLIFFDLIYILKGKTEGLKLVLDAMHMVYKYETWDEMEPKGPRFTATLTVYGDEYNQPAVFAKLQNFVRSYMLPYIYVSIHMTIIGPEMYWHAIGIPNMRKKDKTNYIAVRDVRDLAIYDRGDGYDIGYYSAPIRNSDDKSVPQQAPSVTLSVITTPSNATVELNGVITRTLEAPIGTLVNWKVSQNEEVYETKTGFIYLNQDTSLTIDLNPKNN